MLFAGGPATEGPGLVVGPELRESIRSHHDIDRDNIKYYKKALKVCTLFVNRGNNTNMISFMKISPKELLITDTLLISSLDA